MSIDTKAREIKEAIDTGTDLDDETREMLLALEEDVTTGFKLSDAIRLGSKHSIQERGWGDGETACAMTAAVIAARALGYI